MPVKDAADVGCRGACDGVGSDLVALRQAVDDMDDIAALVALTAKGNGRHVGGVGLQDDAVEGNCGGQHLGQVRLLEREDAADAEHETVELQQLGSLYGVAREAVEDAAGELARIPF